jgi:hypothetical protein
MSDDARTDAADTETATGTETGNTTSSTKVSRKGGNTGYTCKIIFFSVLVVLAMIVAIVFTSRYKALKEQARHDKFSAQVSEIVLRIDTNVDAAFDSLNGLSVLTTSLVKQNAEDTDYPPGFITIPDVSQTLGAVKNASNALVIAYMPKVLAKNYELWESYSPTHSSWVAEEQVGGPMNTTTEIIDYIWEFTDYRWEESNRRLIGDGMPGLRGNAPGRQLENRVMDRPGADCSGNEEERRSRDLVNFGSGRELSNDADEDDDNTAYRFGENDDDEYDDMFDPGPSAQVTAPRSDRFQTPVWQLYPVPVLDEKDPFVQIINYNLSDRIVFKRAVEYIESSKLPVFLDVCDQASWFWVDEHREILQTAITIPVFDGFSETTRTIVGYYTAVIPWGEFFKNIRAPDSMGMIIVMRNSCGEVFSVELKGDTAKILGYTDEHDVKLDKYEIVSPFAQQYNDAVKSYLEYEEQICLYTMHFYPSEM